MENETLYKWNFTYNPYTNKWNAYHTDVVTDYFTNHSNPNVLRHESLTALIEMVKGHTEKGAAC